MKFRLMQNFPRNAPGNLWDVQIPAGSKGLSLWNTEVNISSVIGYRTQRAHCYGVAFMSVNNTHSKQSQIGTSHSASSPK